MRAIAMLAALAVPAAAEPGKTADKKIEQKTDKKTDKKIDKKIDKKTEQKIDKKIDLPRFVEEAAKNAQDVPTAHTRGTLGIDGKVSAGIVITPPHHPDAEPFAEGGSLLVPPDPNDPMALELGTNQLRARAKVEPWLPRDLSRSLQRAADKVWDFLLPDV